jgi:hypothetical protein
MTPEQRIQYLEQRIERLERVMKVQGNLVTFMVPVSFVKGLSIDQAKFIAGYGDPTSNIQAPIGSVYLRLDGTVNNTLYMKEGDTLAGWSATA